MKKLICVLVFSLSIFAVAAQNSVEKKDTAKQKIAELTEETPFVTNKDLNQFMIILYKELTAESFDKVKALRDQWLMDIVRKYYAQKKN